MTDFMQYTLLYTLSLTTVLKGIILKIRKMMQRHHFAQDHRVLNVKVCLTQLDIMQISIRL